MAKERKTLPLIVERVAISELRSDPRNARVHSERNIAAICASLERFGQQKPIVVTEDGVVVAGNGTLEAASRLGWTHIDVVRTRLSGAELAAYGLADNHTGELATYDDEILELVLDSIGPDLRKVVGFDFEISDIAKTKKKREPKEKSEGSGSNAGLCPHCGRSLSEVAES